jgi:2-dehydropantoate 2-reductase
MCICTPILKLSKFDGVIKRHKSESSYIPQSIYHSKMSTQPTNINIVIAGIGGVGGFFGGLLAKRFYDQPHVRINFFARGTHLEAIRKNGLKVVKGDTEYTTKPNLATNNASELGVADFLIIATKSYDLETVIEQLKPCIGPHTIVLPLLNGVDSRERIQKKLPENIVLDGCVYIVARLKEPGVVENIGNIQTLYFGFDEVVSEQLYALERMFQEATIEATLSRNISREVWEKFVFISPTATATSYFDSNISELMGNSHKCTTLAMLIEEVKQLAIAKRIDLADDVSEKTLQKLRGFAPGITSSMHSGFQNNKAATELESLTGYVVREGLRLKVPTPIFLKMYHALLHRSGSNH